jgi:hypothetical protein
MLSVQKKASDKKAVAVASRRLLAYAACSSGEDNFLREQNLANFLSRRAFNDHLHKLTSKEYSKPPRTSNIIFKIKHISTNFIENQDHIR